MGAPDLERLPSVVGEYLERLRVRCAVKAIVLFGSQARGGTDRWSDFDIFVIADDLPSDWWERMELLGCDRPAWVDVVGYTESEVRANLHRSLILDAALEGIVLYGDAAWLRAAALEYIAEHRLVKREWGYRRLEPA